jgi:hypothetical protein
MKSVMVFLVTISLLVSSSASFTFAQEQKRVRVENGIVTFSEEDTPNINIKDLKFNFAPDAPEAIKAIQGKVFGSGVDKKGQAIYLIPLEYDSATKVIKLLYVTNNKGTQYKPTKLTAAGVFNGLEGNSIKPVGDNSEKPWAHFYTVPVDKGYNLRLLWASSGSVTNLYPVAEVLADNKNIKTPQTANATPMPVPKKDIILQSSNSWIVGKWTGFEHGSKGTCRFEVIEKNGKLDSFFMWVDEKDKSKKAYSIPIESDGNSLTFLSSSKDKFVLKRATNDRMDGSITRTNGKETAVRFWKEGQEPSNPRLGIWDGKWNSGWESTLEVQYIDQSSMTMWFTSKDSKGARGFSYYINCDLAFEGKYFYKIPGGEDKVTLQFAQGNQKIFVERVNSSGWTGDQATFMKK